MSGPAAEPLPHRFPFRLVESAVPVSGRRVAVALATANGALVPHRPWPVTLVAEALAQAILLVVERPREAPLRLVALDAVTLHQQVGPGDRLEVEVEELGAFGGLRRFACRGRRDGAIAAEAEVTVSGS